MPDKKDNVKYTALGAILRKELVETSPVTVLSMLMLSVALFMEVANDRTRALFSLVPPEAIFVLLATTAVCAGLIGLVQTIRESFEGTWAYFLHRPGSRRKLLTMKMLAGVTAYSICCGFFLFGHILISLSRRTAVHPVQWWIVNVMVQFMVAGLLIYLGGFLSGIRKARWYGTRLFPLASTVLIWFLILYIPYWWLFGLPILLTVSALLLHSIFATASERDFA